MKNKYHIKSKSLIFLVLLSLLYASFCSASLLNFTLAPHKHSYKRWENSIIDLIEKFV